MITVGALEAKAHLSALLEHVAQGESIWITRHRKAIARIVPGDPEQATPDLKEVIHAIREFRSLIEEGSRF